ncbi:MAG TPA: hypothetical protein DHW34_00060 [Actinobacteria bacterium]|nr:hypothetical protein [Actinomycetota bacterium]
MHIPRGLLGALVARDEWLSLIAATTLGILVVVALRTRWSRRRQFARTWRTTVRRPWVLVVGSVMVMALVDSLVIYPEEHYMAPPIAVGLVVLARWLPQSSARESESSPLGLFSVARALVLVVAAGVVIASLVSVASVWSTPRPYVNAVRELQTCPGGSTMYAVDVGPASYLPTWRVRTPAPQDSDGGDWLRRRDIDAVYVTDLLRSRWPASAWAAFTRDPAGYGFRPVPAGGPGLGDGSARFYVRQNLRCGVGQN